MVTNYRLFFQDRPRIIRILRAALDLEPATDRNFIDQRVARGRGFLASDQSRAAIGFVHAQAGSRQMTQI